MCGSDDNKFVVGDRSVHTCDFKLILTDTFTEKYFIANNFSEGTFLNILLKRSFDTNIIAIRCERS